MILRSPLCSLALAAMLLSCDGTPPEPSPGAVRLSFLDLPATVSAGTPFTPAVQVAVLRGDGSLDPTVTTAVTLRMARSTVADTLRGGTTSATIGGVASFGALQLARAGGTVELVATAPGIDGAVSRPISVLPGAPSRLRFTAGPASGIAGQALAPAPTVVVEDAAGNVTTGVTGTVAITLAAAPAGAAISGPTVASLSAGVAAFPGLQLDRAGSYALTATLIGAPDVAPAVSAPVSVRASLIASARRTAREP